MKKEALRQRCSVCHSSRRLSVRRGLVLLALASWLTVPSAVWAVPIIDKSQAAADARTDPGTGICGSVTHFVQGQSVLSKADAEVILNKPTTDMKILGRTARLFANINFKNGNLNTEGDFTLPNYRDEVLPYSSDMNSMPMGSDYNIALRLRGYFNVPASLAGKTISFGLNCDDFCSLRVGKTDLMQVGNELVSARVISQVSFKDPGLYPIEMVYYQNGSTAYLEWSRTDVAVAECPNNVCPTPLSDSAYSGAFKIVPGLELYSGKTGANPSCQECGMPGMDCSIGNYCGDGLCQLCNLPDHCGPTCMACPTNAHICSAGKCVECVDSAQCPLGTVCLGGKCSEEVTFSDACMPMPACPPGAACSEEKLKGSYDPYPRQKICGCSLAAGRRERGETSLPAFLLLCSGLGLLLLRRRRIKEAR